MQVGDTLRWHPMWDFRPPPHSQIFVCIYVIMLPYFDDIVVLLMGLYGEGMGNLYVPHGIEPLYLPHATCFRKSIAPTMFISVEFFTPCGMDYVHLMMTLEEQFMLCWLGEHLAYEEDLILDGVTNGGGEVLQHSPYQLL